MRVVTFCLSMALVSASRVVVDVHRHIGETCACSADGVINGKDIGKPGCAMHFGQRFGYLCYMNGGSACPGAQLSKRTGAYWRLCPIEKKQHDAEKALEKAMSGIDLEFLERSLKVATEREADPRVLVRAHARVEQVKSMLEVKDALERALLGKNSKAVLVALERAEECELDAYLAASKLEQAVKRMTYLEEREEATEELQHQMHEHDLVLLETKLERAQKLHAELLILQAGEQRVQDLKHEIVEARKQFDICMRGRDPVALHHAIHAVERLLVIDNPGLAKARLEHLHVAHEATEKLKLVIPRWKVVALKEVLTATIAKDAAPEVIAQAETRVVELQGLIEEAKSDLRTSVKGNDEFKLAKAIKECLKLDAVNHDELQQAMKRCNTLENRYEARDELQIEIKDFDVVELQQKLDVAIDLGVDKQVLDKGAARVRELKQMMKDSRSAFETATQGHDIALIKSTRAEAVKLHAVDHRLLDRAAERLDDLALRGEAKADLVVAIEGHDLQELLTTYARAVDLGVDGPTLEQSKQREAEIRAMMTAAKEELQTQIAGRSSLHLREAIHNAKRLSAADSQLLAGGANRLTHLLKMDAAAHELNEIAQTDDMGNLIRAIRDAQAMDVDQVVLDRGEAAMDRIRHMMHEAKSNLKGVMEEGTDAAAIQAALDECTRIRAVSPKRIAAAEKKLAQLR